MNKIQNKSIEILNYIYEIVRKNNIHFDGRYYITKFKNLHDQNGRILFNTQSNLNILTLDEGGESIYFTFNIENKKVYLYNRFEIDATNEITKIIDLIKTNSGIE